MSSYFTEAAKASVFERIKARAPTYWLYMREKPSWFIMFLFARTLVGRRVERWYHNAAYRTPSQNVVSMVGNIDMGRMVNDIIETGIHVGLKLPTDVMTEVNEFAQSTKCFSRDKQEEGFLPKDVAAFNQTRDRDVLAAYYFEAVERCPAIVRLYNDPALLEGARAYLGHDPVLIRTRLWWSFPASRVTDADLHAVAQEKFHFDMNAWRTLKFFFYLTEASDGAGPHRCIPGSHKKRPIKQQLTLTVGRETEELADVYGDDGFLTITGDAGMGFAEDPFVFHTGTVCRTSPRLMLELEYGAGFVSPSYKYGRLG